RRREPRELFLDDPGIELLEQRLRLAQLLSGCELARAPTLNPVRVVAGQDRVRVAAVLFDLAVLERPGEATLVPEQLVQFLAREGQERREDQLQRVDNPKRDKEDRCRALAVLLDHRPGRLVVDVLVPEARESHRFDDRRAEPGLLDELTNGVEALRNRFKHVAICLPQLARY